MTIINYYTVSTEAQLNSAIAAISAGGSSAAANTVYGITIATDLDLSAANLTPINLMSGSTLTIDGNSGAEGNPTAVLDGGGASRGFVVEAGAVTLANLNLINFTARGGAGGAGASAGGGGAGLGGALFVGSGAGVALSNTTFSNGSAAGGRGGTVTSSGVGAGGAGEPNGFGAGGGGGIAGGFGGGGGTGASGGFGAGSNAGGGLAAGGEIFVQQGGTLTMSGGSVDAGRVSGGAAGTRGTAGSAFGGGLFIQGNTTITLSSATVTGVIADQTGSGGTGANAGAGAVDVAGPVTLAAKNTYTGGTAIESGVLTLATAGAAGAGAITFTGADTLVVAAGATPANTIVGFTDTSKATIDLQGVGAPVSDNLQAGNKLVVTGASGSATLQLDPTRSYANDSFYLSTDGTSGTDVQAIQTSFSVASEADLNAALQAIDLTGAQSRPNTAYTITLAAGFTLASDLDAVNLASGDSLTINGGGQTMDGGGTYRGFFVYAGQVAIDNLTIAHAVASGGAGGAGADPGGGGAGLGGGLFVASAGAVTLSGVSFLNDSAVGGSGGAVSSVGIGGGGGLGGSGGSAIYLHDGGGGGIGVAAHGGQGSAGSGGQGILIGGAAGDPGVYSYAGAGGADSGGGGAGGFYPGSGRDPHPGPAPAGAGGDSASANFGGGAASNGAAGFGGGGAVSRSTAVTVNGGFGGGSALGGAPGFGGGSGSGGGGLGAGGAVFVQQGGSLTIAGGSISGGSVAGGAGASAGLGLGAGVFLQGTNTLTLAPGAGQTLTISDPIADEAGSGGANASQVVLNGAGTLKLAAADTFTGGITLDAGTLKLLAPGAAGSGVITFAWNHAANLGVGAGDVPANTIYGFLPGDSIDLQGIGTATSATLGAGDILTVSGGSSTVNLQLAPGQDFTGESFAVASDGKGGTLITPVDAGGDYPPHIFGSGVGIAGADNAALDPLAGVTVAEAGAATLSATLTLSSTANGALSNFGTGSYNSTTGVFTVTGTAAQVTTALDGLVYTPRNHQVAPGNTVQTSFALSVTDGTMVDKATTTANILALDTPPALTKMPTSFVYGLFTKPLALFKGVGIVEPDFGAMVSVTLTTSDASGPLSLAAPVDGISLTETSAGSGVYTLTAGSPAAVAAALDKVLITPTFNASGFQILGVGISVSDGISTTTGGVRVLAGAPIIKGAVANQKTTDTTPIKLFSKVSISDSPEYTNDQVTIILAGSLAGAGTDANGALSGANLSHVGVGTYTLTSGTPAQLTKEIDALTFTPTPHQGAAGSTIKTFFQIAVSNGVSTSDNYTTTVIASETAAAVARFSQYAAIGMPAGSPGATDPIRSGLAGSERLAGMGLAAGVRGHAFA
ncbi:MAG TPA: hypothetical protein VGS12_08485 [Caulobacteraceae bacterium]|nr:hypothetical protein [Caulobacteraceae bacterium]